MNAFEVVEGGDVQLRPIGVLVEGAPFVGLRVPAEPEIFVLMLVPDLRDVVRVLDLFGGHVLPPRGLGVQEVLVCGGHLL